MENGMASPKELVSVVSDVTGLPEGTVTLHDRNLLVAGLRSEGQRGRGVSRVTPRDAAHLLIAVIAAQSVKDSARAVRRHGQRMTAKRWELPFLPIPELLALPEWHTLADAVSALIESGISGTLPAAASAACGSEQDLAHDINPGVEIKVIADNPAATSAILIGLVDEGLAEKQRYDAKQNKVSFVNAYDDNDDPNEILADLKGQFHITHRSIMRVAELLRG